MKVLFHERKVILPCGEDGAEIIRQIRAEQRYDWTPVFGNSRNEVIGADDNLGKDPLKMENFVAQIKERLSKSD